MSQCYSEIWDLKQADTSWPNRKRGRAESLERNFPDVGNIFLIHLGIIHVTLGQFDRIGRGGDSTSPILDRPHEIICRLADKLVQMPRHSIT